MNKNYLITALGVLLVVSSSLTVFLIMNRRSNDTNGANTIQPTAQISPSPSLPPISIVYTETFTDRAFFLAESDGVTGLFFTTPELRNDIKYFAPKGTSDYGVFTKVGESYEQSEKTVKSFQKLNKKVKLEDAGMTIVDPQSVNSIIKGFEPDTYYFSYMTNFIDLDKTYRQYTEKVTFDSKGIVHVNTVRRYNFGGSINTPNRNTHGPEFLKASLSATQFAVNVLNCWGCEADIAPNIYVVDYNTEQETRYGLITNIKAVDGKTFTYETALQKPSECSLDPHFEGICYPYKYISDGITKTGTL